MPTHRMTPMDASTSNGHRFRHRHRHRIWRLGCDSAATATATGTGPEPDGKYRGRRQSQIQVSETETGVRGRSHVQLVRFGFDAWSHRVVHEWWCVAGESDGVKGKPAWERRSFRPLTPSASTACGGVMNDPEVTMHDSQHNNDLMACTVAVEAATRVFALVKRVPAPFRSLADQVVRAASSVAANLSEGNGRCGRDRFNHWRIAYASAKEVDTFLCLLSGAGVVNSAQAREAAAIFDEVRAMTWRLLNPR
ncbi:MAG: four helix bundle protein [bacterium]|nr:four helix bundle protein [bacterium]